MINTGRSRFKVMRPISALLALIMTAALAVPAFSALVFTADAASSNTAYKLDDSYLSGTDFEDLPEDKVISDNARYSHNANGFHIYDAVVKKSTMTVLSDSGNRFVRIERSGRVVRIYNHYSACSVGDL